MRKNWILIEPFTFWYRTSNFVSLLNLLTQTKEYGPVYLHLEGVRERFIQHIKPALTNMRTSTSYLMKKLQKNHQDNTLEIIYANHIDTASSFTNRYDDFQSFDSFQDIEDKIKNGLSFSGVVFVLATTVYGVIIKKSNVLS